MVTFIGGSTSAQDIPKIGNPGPETLNDLNEGEINLESKEEIVTEKKDNEELIVPEIVEIVPEPKIEEKIDIVNEPVNNTVSEPVIIPEVKEVEKETINEVYEELAEKEKEKQPLLKKAEEKLTEVTNWDADKPVSLGVFKFINKSERTIFLAFIIPPLVISLISMIHVVSFFELSNNVFLSWALAAAFEFASISALFALTALTRIKKNTIWILFFAIVLLQVIGNMYHSYVYMNPQDPNLLKMLTIIGVEADSLPWTLRVLGFLQGGILPIVSLSFVKAVVEYLGVNRENK